MFLCYKDSENDMAFINLNLIQSMYLRYRKKDGGTKIPLLTLVFNEDDSVPIAIAEDEKDHIMPCIADHFEDQCGLIDIRSLQY
jgi:hypothetical protein